MMCPTCHGVGMAADPQVMQLIVANLVAGDDDAVREAIDNELDTRRKASGKTGRYWMVGTCPTCNGSGTVTP